PNVLCLYISSFLFHDHSDPRNLHSFPTRRSSDLTNAKMNKDQVIENYQHLWQIENAFRVSKSDLRVRPIYHRLQRRIEAHICISDRKSTRLNSSHVKISYAVFCLKKKKKITAEQ